jgi:hypothetical protein
VAANHVPTGIHARERLRTTLTYNERKGSLVRMMPEINIVQ